MTHITEILDDLIVEQVVSCNLIDLFWFWTQRRCCNLEMLADARPVTMREKRDVPDEDDQMSSSAWNAMAMFVFLGPSFSKWFQLFI